MKHQQLDFWPATHKSKAPYQQAPCYGSYATEGHQETFPVWLGEHLQNGIEHSFDSKLDAALGALNDANGNNAGAAFNTFQAFINAVEAQRGSNLTESQADQLIAVAGRASRFCRHRSACIE